ncbi:MAG: hypothetical protein Q9227_004775 [Pyrenula ochraceoflavens]
MDGRRRSANGIKKRTANAIKKVLVTQGFIRDLQQKANRPSNGQGDQVGELAARPSLSDTQRVALQEDVTSWLGDVDEAAHSAQASNASQDVALRPDPSSSSSEQLMNPLAVDAGNYMADNRGRPFHLGTSSNWSFGRRVLRMTCERLKIQMSMENLHFEGSTYKLDWDDLRVPLDSRKYTLPSADHAIYLINAVKFHCGQMFHLFDDVVFMQHFSIFYENPGINEALPELWYIHYLLIIAFGKAFAARTIDKSRPPGVELFLEAMRRLPEITFFTNDPIEAIEILVCASLYLQCLDFRNAAYNLIGQALRKALEQGWHTKMSSRDMSESMIERCRKAWWTVYMLDRQMTSLMGVPLAIRDEDISAKLPSFVKASQKTVCLELHIKLSQVIADIMNSSTEGRLAKRYLASTKQALKNIANVTTLLKDSIGLPERRPTSGTSRLAAYLHLLHYQCICLTTRPLAYSFLEKRLKSLNSGVRFSVPRGSVRLLLKTCIESAEQMLSILRNLQDQDLLESFLPFDLEALFASAMILVMSTAIDPSLLEDHDPWSDSMYALLDEMATRGNAVADIRKQELQQLKNTLSHLPSPDASAQRENNWTAFTPPVSKTSNPAHEVTGAQSGILNAAMEGNLFDESVWQNELSAEQLMLLADNLDLDGMDWITSSLEASSMPSGDFTADT